MENILRARLPTIFGHFIYEFTNFNCMYKTWVLSTKPTFSKRMVACYDIGHYGSNALGCREWLST